MNRYTMVVSAVERTTIVAALIAYGSDELATHIHKSLRDTADDGPEVEILRNKNQDFNEEMQRAFA